MEQGPAARPGNRRLAWLTPCGPRVAAAVALFAAAIVLSATGGHSHMTDRVSEMAAHGSPRSVVMTAGFVALALAGAMSAWGARTHNFTVAIFAALGATGVLGLAVARCHDGCPPSGASTFGATDAAHGSFAALVVIGWVVAPAIASLTAGASPAYRAGSAAAAALTPALLGLAPLTRFDGFVQLVIFAVMSAWLVATAVEADRRAIAPPELHALSVGAARGSASGASGS